MNIKQKNNNKHKITKYQSGITLVGMVVTIIIMLIMVGVSISKITGEEGLFAKANHAATLYNQKAKEEEETLNQLISGNYKIPTIVENIPELTSSNVTFTLTPSTNINPTIHGNGVMVSITENTGTGYMLQYSLNEGLSYTNYTTPFEVTTYNTVIIARLYSETTGKEGDTTATCTVSNIDTLEPNGFNLAAVANSETAITISGNTTDQTSATSANTSNGNMKYKYALLTSAGTPDWANIEATTDTSKQFTGKTAGTTYYAYMQAIDEASNTVLATNNGLIVTTWGTMPTVSGANLVIAYTPDTNINPSIYNSGQGVKVTITNNTGANYKVEYSLNEGSSWAEYPSGGFYVSTYNQVIIARLNDTTTGRISTMATGTVTNIDTLAPNIFSYNQGTITTSSISISASVTDQTSENSAHSTTANLKYKFAAQTSQTIPTWNNIDAETSSSKTFSGLTAGTTYYIYMVAIDEAGNLREASNNGTAIMVNRNQVTVGFDVNGGTNLSENSRTIYVGDTCGALPTATKDGNVLVGWYTERNGGDKILNNQIITQNVTYYAHWAEVVTNYNAPGSYTYRVPITATYTIECWGAQGANYDSTNVGGKGGYTSRTNRIE